MKTKSVLGKFYLTLIVAGLMFMFPVSSIIAQSVVLGDVNDDAAVTIVDALLVAQYYVGMEPVDFISENADVNASGSTDIVDALLIAQFYVGIIDEFPGQSTLIPTPVPTAFPYDAREVNINESFTMNYGETVKLSFLDFYITFDDVLSDSRCPTEINCVWEGEVEVSLACFSSDKDFGYSNIKAPPGEPVIDRIMDQVGNNIYYYVITCQAVDPYPVAPGGIPREIPVEEYVVTLYCMVETAP